MNRDLMINGELETFLIEKSGEGVITITVEGQSFSFKQLGHDRVHHSFRFASKRGNVTAFGHSGHVSVDSFDVTIEDPKHLKRTKGAAQASGGLLSPMPGKILKVLVEVGDRVKAGDSLLVMEAMKMEHTIKAVQDGRVSELFYGEGELVDGGVALCALEGDSDA